MDNETAGKGASGTKNPAAMPFAFGRDESGSLIVFSLFLLLLMLMIGGMAMDLMRFETQRARLQSTLDRSVLAAASLSNPLSPEEVVVDYFTRAGLGDYIDVNDVTSTTTLSSREVSAATHIDMNTTFMKLLGIQTMAAPAAGTAEESTTQTEVSLVVDVSGSMGWGSSSGNSKIYELRNAATEFVNILQCNPENPNNTNNCIVEPDTVSISMVPYSHQVLAGQPIFDAISVTNEHNLSTCLTFESGDFNTTTINPAVEMKRTGHFDPWYSGSNPPYYLACLTNSWRTIMPLENDPADLRSQISQLGASGNTSIDIGMKWGSALLDPAFRPATADLIASGDVVGAFHDRPFDWTETSVNKVIVLMTDGVNTWQPYLKENYRDGPSGVYRNTSYSNRWSVYRASTDRYYWVRVGGSYWSQSGTWHDHPYGDQESGNAYELSFPELWAQRRTNWYRSFWWLDDPVSWNGGSTKDSRLDAICDAAKAQNITVYALGFEVTSYSAQVMQSCASSPAHYFDVNGSNLSETFAAIARKISPLKLVN